MQQQENKLNMRPFKSDIAVHIVDLNWRKYANGTCWGCIELLCCRQSALNGSVAETALNGSIVDSVHTIVL